MSASCGFEFDPQSHSGSSNTEERYPPPDQPAANKSIAHADDQINHEFLQGVFDLDINGCRLAEKICKMGPANQRAAVIYGTVSNQQKTADNAPVDGPPEGNCRGGKTGMGDTLQDCLIISRASRTLFRRCWSNAEANSFVINPLTKIVINQSTLRLTQEHIKQLSDSVKRTQLPKGYLDKTNAEAVKAVNQQIATIIKCEKNIERSCMLMSIEQSTGAL
ncbi:hypothetical protein KEM48_006181 [Puccinia striiformis f. sp. tritici PST-130]|nr:hypothetical protein H4Q26_006313 [Puccinia striiformis f. sp. tritici PST-130]KAI9619639.1 hypothetical protein KEM48_006181 [Puccinia striiformis f. sp. tritici PST-130]